MIKIIVTILLYSPLFQASNDFIINHFGKKGGGRTIERDDVVTIEFLEHKLPNGDVQRRNLIINAEGFIQVFSSYSTKLSNTNGTSSRVFLLLPQRTKMKVLTTSENGLSFRHPTGATLRFDQNTDLLSNPKEQLLFQNSFEITPNKKGGIEIEKYAGGIIIDFGFKMGSTPLLDLNQKIQIRDPNNKSCTIPITDIMNIFPANYDYALKEKSNEGIGKILQSKCPELNFSTLFENADTKKERSDERGTNDNSRFTTKENSPIHPETTFPEMSAKDK